MSLTGIVSGYILVGFLIAFITGGYYLIDPRRRQAADQVYRKFSNKEMTPEIMTGMLLIIWILWPFVVISIARATNSRRK